MAGNPRGSGYDRNADNWYQETPACVDAFLEAELLVGNVWDPACGAGNIPERCRARGLDVFASDLRDRGYGDTGVDFLRSSRTVDNIVTNPPFRLAEPFVRHALTMARRKVAIVTRVAFIVGRARCKLLTNTPVSRIWVIPSRVAKPPSGKAVEAKNGSVAYCWIVWDHDWRAEPLLGWLP
jgi:hypothetical protein